MSQIRAVSARSAMLTMMIGGPTSRTAYTSATLVAFAGAVGISETTARAALSRLLSTGDLIRDGASYQLADRLLERQARQRARLSPRVRTWRGDWELVVVTASGRSAADRAALRTALVDHRLAELREGVWLRPDTLAAWPDDEVTRRFVTRPVEDVVDLVAPFQVDEWAARGRVILEAIHTAGDEGERFTACVAGVRHLLIDPLLPSELLPEDWPAAEIRAEYDVSVRWMASYSS